MIFVMPYPPAPATVIVRYDTAPVAPIFVPTPNDGGDSGEDDSGDADDAGE